MTHPNSERRERQAAALAATQHGVISWSQLREIGVTSHLRKERVRRGWLERVQPGVYRLAGAPATLDQALMAACLSAGPIAAVSHRSAAWLWGLDGPFQGVLEISVERVRQAAPAGVVLHRSTDLHAGHVRDRRGLPVTSPARTLVDLGAVVSQRVLDRAVDEALARRLVTLDELVDMLAEVGRRGRRGVGPLRRSLAGRKGVPDSVLDDALERLLMTSGIEGVEIQYEIFDEAGRFVARVDAAVPRARVIVEADGASTRVGRDALQYDVSRQNTLVQLDWLILRFTWGDVVGRPDRTLAEIRRAVRRRAGELGCERSA